MSRKSPCPNCNTTITHSDRTGCCGSCKRVFKGVEAWDRHWTTPKPGERVCVDPHTVESGGAQVYLEHITPDGTYFSLAYAGRSRW